MSYNRSGAGKPKGMGFSGFQMPKRTSSAHSMHAVPPPAAITDSGRDRRERGSGSGSTAAASGPNAAVSRQGYSTLSAISQNALTVNWGGTARKRSKTEDEYFDEDDESISPSLAYIPAPGSPTNQQAQKKKESSDEEDPLDAFMAGLEKQVKTADKVKDNKETSRGTRGDIEEEDDEETYYKYMEENPLPSSQNDGSDVEIEYDEDGNPLPPPKKRYIDPLPPIDHSEIVYEPFEKNFYTLHEDIVSLSMEKVEDLKKALGIKITGVEPPHPVTSFSHFGFDEALMKGIRKVEYSQPTPIQAAGIPVALSGRDLIGIARTGSGKTAAYLWPLLVHIMDQKELKTGDGPIGLILAPTRELAQQIYSEAKRFGKVYNIQCICCFGGGSKWEQSKALESGAEIVVGTPGRMIDLIKIKATNLQRVTYLVIDEADRMFDLGFEGQVRSICAHVRPDRQTLLFSATFPRRVEKLARDALRDPLRIQHGDAGEASADVQQSVMIFKNQPQKWTWLLENLVQFLSTGSVLIFVTKKLDAEQVAGSLAVQQYDVLLLHGDMDQVERNKVITAFKKRESNLLVATDVAARGLDFPHIRTVINYDVARDIDTHTHRVGRTGRAGVRGDAITLVLADKDKEFAGHLVRNFEGASQEVPQTLLDLAMQSNWFRKSRFKAGKGKNLNVGGCGLGFKERPGLQCVESDINVEGLVYSESKKGGPATNRLAAMKAAYKLQYNQFTASSDDTWQKSKASEDGGSKSDDDSCFAVPLPPAPVQMNVAPPPPPPMRKSGKKSRWE